MWRGSSGSAELNGSRPAPVDGRFRAGSVTKSFVATVVLQLVGEGRLRLTDSIERWLPGLIPGGGRITMTDLLAHSRGLPDYTTALLDEDGLPYQRFRTWSPAELIRMAHPDEPDFPPGTKNVYSNTNYIVLGMVIEKVTGHPYRAEIQRRILRHTWLPGAFPYLTGPHAHGYVRVKRTGQTIDITTFNPSMAGSAGEIISTTTDLNRFFSALLAGCGAAEGKLAFCKNDVNCSVKVTTGEEEIKVTDGIRIKVAAITDDTAQIAYGSDQVTAREDGHKYKLGKLKITLDNADGKTHRAQLTVEY